MLNLSVEEEVADEEEASAATAANVDDGIVSCVVMFW